MARKVVLLAGGLAIVATVACGSSDNKKDSSSTPAGSDTSAASSTSGAAKLNTLTGYRYKVHMEGTGTGGPLAGMRDSIGYAPGQSTPTANQAVTFDADGAYVKPDKAQYTVKIGSFQVGQTVIGKQEWVTFGGTTTGPQPTTSTNVEDLSLVATIFDDNFSDNFASKTTCSSSKEMVNGVASRKCSLDKPGLEKLDPQFGGFFDGMSPQDLSKFQLDLWVADSGGYPIKLSMDLSGKDSDSKDFALKIEINLTDINKNIEIKPPK